MTKRELGLRYLIGVIGIFFIGLGVAFAKHSALGISPVSSVANVLSIRFSALTVGTWVMIWNCFLIVLEILLKGKAFKPIELLQFPVSLLLGVFTDIGMEIVTGIPATIYVVKLLLVLIGTVIIAFGITLTIFSGKIMNVGEAFVNVVASKLHKEFGVVKVAFDIASVGISVVLSLIFFQFTVVGVREGTLFTACLVGVIVRFFVKYLKKPCEYLLKGTK